MFILQGRKPEFIALVVESSNIELVEVNQQADQSEIDEILKQMAAFCRINILYYFTGDTPWVAKRAKKG